MTWDAAPEKVEQFRVALLACGGVVGSGATATATVAGGAVTGVTVTAPGTLYLHRPTVLLSGGGGRGALVRSTVAGGAVTGFTVENGGAGYTSAPTVLIIGLGMAEEDAHYPDAALLTDDLPFMVLAEGDPYEAERSAPGESMARGVLQALFYFPASLAIGEAEAALRDITHQLCEFADGLFVVKARSTRASKVKRRQGPGAATAQGKQYYTGLVEAEWEG